MLHQTKKERRRSRRVAALLWLRDDPAETTVISGFDVAFLFIWAFACSPSVHLCLPPVDQMTQLGV